MSEILDHEEIKKSHYQKAKPWTKFALATFAAQILTTIFFREFNITGLAFDIFLSSFTIFSLIFSIFGLYHIILSFVKKEKYGLKRLLVLMVLLIICVPLILAMAVTVGALFGVQIFDLGH